jgi:hypothetical protein
MDTDFNNEETKERRLATNREKGHQKETRISRIGANKAAPDYFFDRINKINGIFSRGRFWARIDTEEQFICSLESLVPDSYVELIGDPVCPTSRHL